MNMITSKIKPTFEIYRSDTTKVPTLKKSFLLKQRLDSRDVLSEEIIGDDGTEWALVIEPEALVELEAEGFANCIISFQVHSFQGKLQNYAVARLISKDRTFPLFGDQTKPKGIEKRTGNDRRMK